MSHLHEKCGIGGVKQGEQDIFIISFSSLANQGMLKMQLNTQEGNQHGLSYCHSFCKHGLSDFLGMPV